MIDPLEEIQTYYTEPFLPPTIPIWVDIFKNDYVILEKLGEHTEFPKSSEKRLAAWILKYQAYLGEEVCIDNVDIISWFFTLSLSLMCVYVFHFYFLLIRS